MIAVVFTVDYELYGSGEGSLIEHVFEPSRALTETFQRHRATYTTFVEVAELEVIEAAGTDAAIDRVKGQIGDLHRSGFELGLHIHPQWYRGRREEGRWVLDRSEYDLCRLAPDRIRAIVGRAVSHLRALARDPAFAPLAFRAGNWLFQPSQPLTSILAGEGIRVDSSVYKGGRQRLLGLDYRAALKNGYFWRFGDDVTKPDPRGGMLEVPVYTEMRPVWRLLTAKRLGLERKAAGGGPVSARQAGRWRDLMRFSYPVKLDFCRLTLAEMTGLVEAELERDRKSPDLLRPVVAIGHTKDLVDLEAIDRFLGFLEAEKIPVLDFKGLTEEIARRGAGER